jgi:ATP/maltotriose-dependent transcriptional regulator MalT
VLAARAARRIAESIRRAIGRTALAGDAEHLLPVLEATPQRDVFDDPFADAQPERRPMLLVLDDGSEEPVFREQRGRLLAAASSRGVRVETVSTDASSDVARYASLLLSGTYAAEYLRVGLVEE